MIWVIGGTANAKIITEDLLNLDYNIIMTATTKEGAGLIKDHENLMKYNNPLNKNMMKKLIKKYKIKAVIDSSHPYAVEVSNNAIEISQKLKIPYFRYERESMDIKELIKVKDYDEAYKYLINTKGNILITTGSKYLYKLKNIDKKRLYVRILPEIKSIKKCKKIGLKTSQIIAMQGPFSKELNKAILKNFNIKYLLTKESGKEGGVTEKIEAAEELGIKTIIIERPLIKYPALFYNRKELINKIKELN